MQSTNPVLAKAFDLPEDLRVWVDDGALAYWIRQTLESTAGRGQGGHQEASSERARMLLGVLAYCYAIGLFASQEVADRCVWDPQLKQLGSNLDVIEQELRHSRRYHRRQLQSVLERIFSRAAEFHMASTDEVLPKELPALAARSAEQRIEQAILRDSAALDV